MSEELGNRARAAHRRGAGGQSSGQVAKAVGCIGQLAAKGWAGWQGWCARLLT